MAKVAVELTCQLWLKLICLSPLHHLGEDASLACGLAAADHEDWLPRLLVVPEPTHGAAELA